MLITKSIFAAWVLLFCAMALLALLRITRLWKGYLRPLCWILALMLGLSAPVLGRPDPRMSFSATLTRETLRFVMRLPFLNENSMPFVASSCLEGEWKPPREYTNKRFTYGDDVHLEQLQLKDSMSDHVILMLHGGSFILGYNNVYRNLAVRYSKLGGGATVLSVDYKTAPLHTHPAALFDALAAYEYLLGIGTLPQNIIVIGDSAGGNLALSLTAHLIATKKAAPAAVICLSPWADIACLGDSYDYNLYNDPTFGKAPGKNDGGRSPGLSTLYAGQADLKDPALSPVYADYSGFPPLLLHVGTVEMLESDSLTIFKKCAAVGVDVTLLRFHGMFHAFHILGDLTPESKAAWAQVGDFMGVVFKNS